MFLAPPPVVSNPLFLLDYDGTLAPLTEHPMTGYPHAEAKTLVQRLEAQHPLWIITGRHLRDLGVLLGLPVQAMGLHGAQEGVIGGELRSSMSPGDIDAIAALRDALPQIDGAWIEDKEHTFTLHFSELPEAIVREHLSEWLGGVPDGIEAIWGKRIMELRARGVSKGVAVKRIVSRYADRTPVFLGDDVTDEDAFAALDGEAVTVKVGEGPTSARYRLPDVDSVIAYLRSYLG